MGNRNVSNIPLASSMGPPRVAPARARMPLRASHRRGSRRSQSERKTVMRHQRMFSGVLTVLAVLAHWISAAPEARAEATGWPEALPALHTQMDARRNRLWVLENDAVYLFDAATRRLIRRVELPGWLNAGESSSCAPALALAPSGAAFVTSNITPTIWEIDPQLFVVRQHRLSLDADNDKDVGFTELAFSANGERLFGVSSLLGSVWTIDLAEDSAQKVPLSKRVHGACGALVRLPSNGGRYGETGTRSNAGS
jgi:hypothetical protein